MVKHYSFDNKTIYLAMLIILWAVSVPIYKTVVDIGPGVTHLNHEDTITTPLPGNCDKCSYPNCGGCDGRPQITLMPTEIIPTIPPFGGTVVNPATPEIPHPTPCGSACATVFPTFELNGLLPTALLTRILPTIAPTVTAPGYPASPVPLP